MKMSRASVILIAAVVLGLLFVFRSRSTALGGSQVSLMGQGIPQNSALPSALAASFAGLGASIASALKGNNSGSATVAGGTLMPQAPLNPAQAASFGTVPSYYAHGIGSESIEEPTFVPGSSTFTQVGPQAPLGSGAPEIPILDNGTTGSNTAILNSLAPSSTPQTYGSLDASTSGYEVDALTNIFGTSSYT